MEGKQIVKYSPDDPEVRNSGSIYTFNSLVGLHMDYKMSTTFKERKRNINSLSIYLSNDFAYFVIWIKLSV